MLLSKVWDKYQLDKKIEGYSPLTLKTYCFQYNMLLRYFGDIDLNKMTTVQLKEYLIKGSTHLKPSSLGHRVRCIRSLFKWANDEGLIKKNPAAKLKEPKIGKRIPKFLTELEIEHLRESCQNAMENALFEFFYSTGCRIGNEGKQGYIFSPRRICWSDSSDSIVADLESEILIKDAIFQISKTPVFRCENCKLVVFKYK